MRHSYISYRLAVSIRAALTGGDTEPQPRAEAK